MKAILTYHNKELSTNGDITEIKIWKVPVTPDKPHGFKYSLVFIMRTNGSSVTITPNKKGIIVISAIRN